MQAAIRELQQQEQVQLWVVYVDSFSGENAQEWAEATAQESDLGLSDALLAVATGDRAYAYSVDEQFPLSDAQLAQVANVATEPALAQNDWAGAAIGMANGIGQAMNNQPVTPPDIQPGEAAPSGGDDEGGGSTWWLWLLLLAAAAGAAAFFFLRRRREPATAPSTEAPGEADEYASLSTDDLRRRADVLLVETDDAVKTSEQELGFAVAEFGEEHTGPFTAALQDARSELKAAFQLRKQLEDSEPEDEASTRAMLIEICRRTDAASDRLDAEAAKFDELRKLTDRAPQLLTDLEGRLREVEARVPAAESTLSGLSATYAATALATVSGNVDEARKRIAFAREQVAAGQAQVQAGNLGRAAAAARAAEEASGQAVQLLDAIDRTRTDLAEAETKIAAATADAQRGIAEARAHGNGTLAAAVAAAEAAIRGAEQAASPAGGRDPIGALRGIEEADRTLDQALQGVRDAQARRASATAALEPALLAARASISAASDFITTRRGAVGSEARTRLAEAQRHFDEAMGTIATDPVTALQHAQAADALAEEALQIAHADTDQFQTGGAGGPLGGGGGSVDIGAILGGILIGGMVGGGGRGGGGFGGGDIFGGGGGFGGGDGGGFGPGSFGGRGTRARRGGGGRF